MKKNWFVLRCSPLLLAGAFILLNSFEGRTAVISGSIKHAEAGLKVEVFIPDRYVSGKDKKVWTQLDGVGHFELEFSVSAPQLVFLILNEDQLAVFVAPMDTVQIRADAFQFPLAVHFLGNTAANNQLLQTYLRSNPLDFNEFNNIRFKIGQYWTSVESAINSQMEDLRPIQFKPYMDTLRQRGFTLLAQTEQSNPGQLSPELVNWLEAEITYFWAYHLLVYGHVYAGRHGIASDFFDFMYEAPIQSAVVGSAWYRQFLLAFMARQQARVDAGAMDFWKGEYQLSGKLLSERPLAFVRSEIISMAFSQEHFRELLPIYRDFLERNEYSAYDEKVEGLYQKYAGVLPGAQAPAFIGLDYYGADTRLEQFRGKVVYLNFWASWCGACIRKMEIMDGFSAEFAAKGIEVVHVSLDAQESQWGSALAEYAFSGHHLLSSRGSIAAQYGVEAVPQYFIIGRTGLFIEKPTSNQPMDIRLQLLEAAKK